MKLSHLTALRLKDMIEKKQTSSFEIMKSVLDEIAHKEKEINAYITLRNQEELLEEANRIDIRRAKGESLGVLSGLPISIKDNICTKGILTTCASKMLSDFIPPYNAKIVSKIIESDGIIIGKTNLDEFSMGSSTENSAIKITHNPHNLDYVPGGTSGGSAAAVAAHETILAIGADTGGSIRQPASFCGVVGMKPTYGLVSRYGLIAYASSLDQVGVLTKNVEDAAMLMSVIAGYDQNDSTSLKHEIPHYLNELNTTKKMRVGVPKEYFSAGLDSEVGDTIENAIMLLEQEGHEIVPISLPHTEYAVATYYVIACSEASSNLSRYSGVVYGHRSKDCETLIDLYKRSRTEGFGDEVKRRILIGTYALSAGYFDAYYLKASKVRTLISKDFKEAFKTCDVIAHPVAPTTAYRIGEKVNNPLSMYLGDVYSVVANLTGLPAISIPCGLSENKLPIGIQFISKAFNESELFSASYTLQEILK